MPPAHTAQMMKFAPPTPPVVAGLRLPLLYPLGSAYRLPPNSLPLATKQPTACHQTAYRLPPNSLPLATKQPTVATKQSKQSRGSARLKPLHQVLEPLILAHCLQVRVGAHLAEVSIAQLQGTCQGHETATSVPQAAVAACDIEEHSHLLTVTDLAGLVPVPLETRARQ
eukprot:CAMPEP_0202922622 /NCGR_PEP_ID=MMETSP1392-20130828/78016_1 /ASSEMBLY_ACC=CAM_ASM_000868 /TAXON_ID=225041 /ORGANISM="Chlamydomonas chlamydogama, Strain SAG 11-48b" /LENGTH=168 /DNA_ID=CAMNT_0049616255 /DNA_START=381 /DNA_END=888 /DNA_ORIENTATION=+